MTRPNPVIDINGRRIGPGEPVYVVAELSCNHGGKFEEAVRLIEAAHEAGADAVKLQTYTPDTITLKSEAPPFRIAKDNTWGGRTLHDLYQEAHTPWEWQPKLQAAAKRLGITLFSSPFDATAVDFLERMQVPAYKIASFEIVDVPLIQRVARTGKPLLLSTGLASLAEIAEAVTAAREAGAEQIALLKCTSNYPAQPGEMHLSAMRRYARAFHVPVGLSDHTQGIEVAIAAAALGACVIEKHLILSRARGGPDAGFSLEPEEFGALVRGVRKAQQAIGTPEAPLSPNALKNRLFRRSLFAVAEIKAGEWFTEANVRSICPGHGLAPKHLPQILTHRAACDIARGTPLTWELIGGPAAAIRRPHAAAAR